MPSSSPTRRARRGSGGRPAGRERCRSGAPWSACRPGSAPSASRRRRSRAPPGWPWRRSRPRRGTRRRPAGRAARRAAGTGRRTARGDGSPGKPGRTIRPGRWRTSFARGTILHVRLPPDRHDRSPRIATASAHRRAASIVATSAPVITRSAVPLGCGIGRRIAGAFAVRAARVPRACKCHRTLLPLEGHGRHGERAARSGGALPRARQAPLVGPRRLQRRSGDRQRRRSGGVRAGAPARGRHQGSARLGLEAAFRIAAGELQARARQAPPLTEPMYELPEPAAELTVALRQLPAQQRAAVVLHYYADRPIHEIAEVLGTSASTVAVHLHRGRNRLRDLLGDDDA